MGISWIVEQVGSIMMAVTLLTEGIDELDGDKIIAASEAMTRGAEPITSANAWLP